MSSLSILIPTYGRARWLEALLRTIARDPAASRIEVLVSDNASPDHTVETVRFVQRDIPALDLTLKVQDENLGAIGNLKWLVSSADTEYVWLFGDDDHPLPDAIGYVRGALEEVRPNLLHLPHRFQSTPGSTAYKDSPCPVALETFSTAAELLRRYHHWLSFLSASVVRRTVMERSIADAPTESPWAPHIWYALAARDGAAVAARRLVVGAGEVSWLDRFRLYMTTRVVEAFDEGFHHVIDAHEYGRLIDERYREFGVHHWEGPQLDELIDAVGRFPTSRLMRARLAELARHAGRIDAYSVLEAAAREAGDGELADEFVADGERRFLAGDLAGAGSAFQNALAIHPTHPDAWCDLGVALNAQGHFEAVDAFDRALDVKPDHVDALLNRAAWAVSQGLSAQAAHDARRVVEQQPEHEQAQQILASIGEASTSPAG